MTDTHDDLANRRKEWFGGRAYDFHNDLRADYERYIDDFRDPLTKQMLEAAGYRGDDKPDVRGATRGAHTRRLDVVMIEPVVPASHAPLARLPTGRRG
jgi:hypothetical protein